MPKRKIKAPKYFLDIVEESNEIEKSLAELIGVSETWLAAQRRKEGKVDSSDFLFKKINDLPRGKKSEALRLLEYNASYMKFAWAKFRFKNIDNEFGKASRVHFDDIKETIEIKTSPMDFLDKMLGKFSKEFGDEAKAMVIEKVEKNER